MHLTDPRKTPLLRYQPLIYLAAILTLSGCGSSQTAISLVRIPRFTAAAGQPSHATQIAADMTLLKSPLVISKALEKQGIRSLKSISETPNPVEWLGAHLSVDNPGSSEIISVSLESNNGKDAMKVLDAIVETYLEDVDSKAILVQPAVIPSLLGH